MLGLGFHQNLEALSLKKWWLMRAKFKEVVAKS
jgi:hypothetical protein